MSIKLLSFISFSENYALLSVWMHACMLNQLLSHVRLFTTPWTAARHAPLPMEFSRQEC